VVTAHQAAELGELDAFGAQHLVDAGLLTHVQGHLAQLARPLTHGFEHSR
jgi:hypothetical protein